MRATPAMLKRTTAAARARLTIEKAPSLVELARGALADREKALGALEGGPGGGARTDPIVALVERLEKASTDAPPSAAAGLAAVRVVGVRKAKSGAVVPLGGMQVRLVANATVREDRTDTTGLALVPLPALVGTVGVQVIGPDGETVLGERKLEIARERVQGTVIPIGYAAALEPAFASGEAWQRAMAAAAKRIAALAKGVGGAVAERVETLKAEVAKLNDQVVKLARAARADR